MQRRRRQGLRCPCTRTEPATRPVAPRPMRQGCEGLRRAAPPAWPAAAHPAALPPRRVVASLAPRRHRRAGRARPPAWRPGCPARNWTKALGRRGPAPCRTPASAPPPPPPPRPRHLHPAPGWQHCLGKRDTPPRPAAWASCQARRPQALPRAQHAHAPPGRPPQPPSLPAPPPARHRPTSPRRPHHATSRPPRRRPTARRPPRWPPAETPAAAAASPRPSRSPEARRREAPRSAG